MDGINGTGEASAAFARRRDGPGGCCAGEDSFERSKVMAISRQNIVLDACIDVDFIGTARIPRPSFARTWRNKSGLLAVGNNMDGLRVLIASTPVGPLGSGIGGGVELTLHNLVYGLGLRGHHVEVVAPANSLHLGERVHQIDGAFTDQCPGTWPWGLDRAPGRLGTCSNVVTHRESARRG